MPAKGTHKLNPRGKRPETQMALPNELYDKLDRLGRANGIINPRTGNGNRTKVIERLFAQLPVFSKAKAVIELCLEHLPPDKQAIAESVLLELEDLEIEQAYEEARIEGSLPEPKTGAWIV